ncbi:MAG TPA: phage holin family protein [Burkholderiales bacterium]
MTGFVLRWVVGAVGLWLAAEIVEGIHVAGAGTLLLAALLLGVVNAVVRPVLVLLTLPITVVTLGLFLLVINAAMLGLVALLLPGFAIDGFFAALLGSIIVSIVGWLASWFIGPRGRIEVIVHRM